MAEGIASLLAKLKKFTVLFSQALAIQKQDAS